MNEYLDLFLVFAKMGVMTFGGGMAMLPILQREIVEDRHWATEEELVDYYATGHHCRQHGYLYRPEAERNRRRDSGHAGHCIPVSGHYQYSGRADHQFFRSGMGAERLCRDSGLCLRADFQRRGQAAEKIRD